MAPRSGVWKFFTKFSSTSVKCEICGTTLKCSNNTSNMLQHLKLKHESQAKTLKAQSKNAINLIESDEESPSTSSRVSNRQTKLVNNDMASTSSAGTCSLKQQPIQSALHNIQSFASGGSKNEKITQAIAEMIVTDNLPFSHVEGKGFIKFMRTNFPLYKVPCRNTIKNCVDKMYDKKAEEFKEKLSQVPKLCLSTDIWTDSAMKSMLGITVHGLVNFKPFCGTIGVFELSESHTAEHISTVFKKALNEFNINEANEFPLNYCFL